MLHNFVPRASLEGSRERVHTLSIDFEKNKTGTNNLTTAEELGIVRVLRRVVDRAGLIDADRNSDIGYKMVPVAHVSILNSEDVQK